MAILNDLAKESSFRGFYLRWLAACWLPVVVVVLIWSSGWVLGETKVYSWLNASKPFELWLLVGMGQWWFLRRKANHATRWAIATGIGGIAATFIWACTTPYVFVRMIGLMPQIGVYALPFLGLPYGSPIVAVAGGVATGLAFTLLQAPLLSTTWSYRAVWLCAGSALGGILYVSLIPLQEALYENQRMLMHADFPSFAWFIVMSLAMMMPTYMMANWFLHSAATGVLLWTLRRRELDRQNNAIQQTFE